LPTSTAIATDRDATFAARADPKDYNGDVANAPAIVHGKGRGHSHALFSGAVFRLTIIFVSFILFASPSPMVIGELIIFALSATGAIYLMLELSQPFGRLVQIRSAPLRNALLPLEG
jgi:hypothetical protein